MENEENLEEYPEEEDFDDNDDFGKEDQYDSNDEDAEELFRENPLKAIFIRLGEIVELLEDG